MKKIKIRAAIDAVPFKRTIVKNGHYVNPCRYVIFREQLGYLARLALKDLEPLKKPIKISVKVYRQCNPSSLSFGDADNHLKAVLDALNTILYADDSQIVDARIRLYRGEPRIVIEAGEVT